MCLLGGCTWLAQALDADERALQQQAQHQRAQKLAEQHRREVASEDERLAAKLEQQRALVGAQYEAGAVEVEAALQYAELVERVHQVGASNRGLIDGAFHRQQALEFLTAANAGESPEDAVARSQLLQVQTRLLVLDGQVDRAAQLYVGMLEVHPDLQVFRRLYELPPTSATDAAVVAACRIARPAVLASDVVRFVEDCLARTQGDRSALSWPGIEADYAKLDVVLTQRALERDRQEKQRAREAAQRAVEEAKREAEEKKLAQMRDRYAYAAVFAAGRCEFGDCVHRGWTARTPDGDVRVRCEFGECLTRGWEARFPDGTTAQTRCEFSECMTRGWETRFPDGTTARTRCEFGECATRGWETRLPDGTTARTRCEFSECYTRGWETRMPDGSSIRCRCNFGECLERGADCG